MLLSVAFVFPIGMSLVMLITIILTSKTGFTCWPWTLVFSLSVWIRLCLAKCPEVVNDLEHTLQTCFLLGSLLWVLLFDDKQGVGQ